MDTENIKTKFLNYKKQLYFYIIFFTLPLVSFAQTTEPKNDGIIPKCGTGTNPECGFNDLIYLINNLINKLILYSFPIAAVVFAWAGYLYMTSGVVDQRSKAKTMMFNVAKGYAIILAAWLIVGTIFKALVDPSISVPVQF